MSERPKKGQIMKKLSLPKIKSTKKEKDVDVTSEIDAKDKFDILPSSPRPNTSKTPPTNLLTVDKVQAVRFYREKEGYAYKQVETFTEQVKITLQYLENEKFEKDTKLHENAEEINDLQERVQTLQATIEVFRVSGDPVTNKDGSYLTLSQVPSESENPLKDTEIESLKTRIVQLGLEKETAIEDAKTAWQEEANLRKYLEEDLLPWVKSREELFANSKVNEPIINLSKEEIFEDVLESNKKELEDGIEPIEEQEAEHKSETTREEVVEHTIEPIKDEAIESIKDEVKKPVVLGDGWDIKPETEEQEIEFLNETGFDAIDLVPSIPERTIVISHSRKDILASSPELEMLAEEGVGIDIIEDPESDESNVVKENLDTSINSVLALSPEALIAREDSLREGS